MTGVVVNSGVVLVVTVVADDLRLSGVDDDFMLPFPSSQTFVMLMQYKMSNVSCIWSLLVTLPLLTVNFKMHQKSPFLCEFICVTLNCLLSPSAQRQVDNKYIFSFLTQLTFSDFQLFLALHCLILPKSIHAIHAILVAFFALSL